MGGRLIVKVLPSKEQQIESLVIPSTANSNLSEGLVKLVDPELEKFIPVGNIVVFPTGSGVGQYIGNDPMLWLEFRDVWAVFAIDEE